MLTRRKSGDATHFATNGPAPRRYDGRTAAARVRAAVFVPRSEYSNALVGDGVPRFRRARRTSTALSVACSSLRQKPGYGARHRLLGLPQHAAPRFTKNQPTQRPNRLSEPRHNVERTRTHHQPRVCSIVKGHIEF